MPTVIPYVPQNITVHLGAPGSNAANVTVPFVDYVKNVASSEIYPTWDESALRANILAIVSFALNRVYTEFYRSRGYDFDITSSTAYDQYFVNGRSFFENIERIVDDLFNDYLRRPGFVEPLAAKFCNGTTVTCEGLSQWGSQNLAQQGYNENQILRSYYGNVETVVNAPVLGTQCCGGSGCLEPDRPELSRNPKTCGYRRDLRSPYGSLCTGISGNIRLNGGRRGRQSHLVCHRKAIYRRDKTVRAAQPGSTILCHQLESGKRFAGGLHR